MITPTVWASGPVAVTESAGLGGAGTWQLIDPATGTVLFTGFVDSAAADRVTFTPFGATPGTYTVALLDTTGAQILRYVSAFAVVTTAPVGLPDGITVEWVDGWGAVRFKAGGMAANETVKMAGPGGILVPIRGYETADWHAGSTDGFGYAFEMPLGVNVVFRIVDAAATTHTPGILAGDGLITTPENRAWLRDLHQPTLSLEVAVVSTGDEEQAGRQTVHKVAGRSKPIVRWDVREGRAGTVTLKVENVYPNTNWYTTYRDRLDLLLSSGRPLLLSMCHTKGFPPCYLTVSAVRYSRVSGRARWACELDYIEVDNPAFIDVILPVEVTYAQAQLIPPGATYADWATTTYLDIATRTS